MVLGRRLCICAPLVVLLVLFIAARAGAQYPVPTLTPQVAPTTITQGVPLEPSVAGVKIKAPTEELLPVTGSDVAGLALVAGLLISLGTMFSLRAPGRPRVEHAIAVSRRTLLHRDRDHEPDIR